MNKHEMFLSYLASLRNPKNENLIESAAEAYITIVEGASQSGSMLEAGLLGGQSLYSGTRPGERTSARLGRKPAAAPAVPELAPEPTREFRPGLAKGWVNGLMNSLKAHPEETIKFVEDLISAVGQHKEQAAAKLANSAIPEQSFEDKLAPEKGLGDKIGGGLRGLWSKLKGQ